MYFGFLKTFPKLYGNNDVEYFYFYPKDKNSDFSKIKVYDKSTIFVNFENYESNNIVKVEIDFYQKTIHHQITKYYQFIESKWKLKDCTKIVGGTKTTC